MKIKKIVLSNPEDRSRSAELLEYIHGPITDLLCYNKDGGGDASGSIPVEGINIFRDTYLGYERIRLLEREQDYLDHIQRRCEPCCPDQNAPH